MALLLSLLLFVSVGCSLGRVSDADDTNFRYVAQNLSENHLQDLESVSKLQHVQGTSLVRQLFSMVHEINERSYNCSLSHNALSDTLFLAKVPNTAVLYIDASSKIPDGILQGKFMWVGDYQECLDTIQPVVNNQSGRSFKGKYFSASLIQNGHGFFPNPKTAPEGFPIIMGLCLPDSYSMADAKCGLSIALDYVQSASWTPSQLKNLNITVNTTYTDEGDAFDGGSITALVISGIIVALVLIGTFTDLAFSTADTDMTLLDGGKDLNKESTNIIHESTDYDTTDRSGLLDGDMFGDSIQYERWSGCRKKVLDVSRAFSFISNAKKLLNTSTAKSPLACLNGLRVISMWWVIQGHVYGFSIYLLDNAVYGGKITQRFTFQAILNGTFSVDTFFFLSGLLVAYLALKELKDTGRLSWIYFFLHRFWRLTPLYAFVLMIFTTLTLYMFSGPYISVLKAPDSLFLKAIDTCKDYWWTNLIYINNFYPDYGSINGTCMGWAWYLAIDMQCYIFLAPVVIILLHKRRLLGVSVAVGLVVVCIAIRGFLVSYYGMKNFQPPITKHLDDPWGQNGPLYQRPYARWSVYIVGMLTGHVCNATNCRMKINRLLALLGWCVSTATALAVVYGLYYYNSHPPATMTPVASGFYLSLSRTLWAMCLSWVVLACVSGYGGPVNSILSWQIWAPLGRLTFAAYLVHPIIIFVYYFNLVTPLHFTDLTMIYLYIANLVVSYAIAFIVSMAVEAPMMQLEKFIVKRE